MKDSRKPVSGRARQAMRYVAETFLERDSVVVKYGIIYGCSACGLVWAMFREGVLGNKERVRDKYFMCVVIRIQHS